MVIATFSVYNKARKVYFFEETFLLADISIDVALRMLFLTLSNADIRFTDRESYWKTYSISRALPIIHHIELINQKEFAVAVLGKDDEVFVVYVTSLAVGTKITVHPYWMVWIALLIADKAPVITSTEYSDFADVFSPKFTVELSKYIEINNHPIELIDYWQPPHGPIYSLELV